MVALPAVPSGRAVHVVVALAAMMVSAAVTASLLMAPRPDAPPPPVVRTEPPPPIHYAPPPPPAFTTGIAACDDYIAEIDAFSRCEKLPRDARESMITAVAQLKIAWKDLPSGPGVTEPTADACRQAVDAIRQAADSMSCRVQP